jgi:hypothetical protein
MRALLVSLALLTTLSVIPAPAAALSSCSGAWTGSNQCAFICNDLNIYVSGTASNLGAIAGLTVTADCGVAAGGVFVVAFSVSCTATGPGTASCSSSGPNTSYPLPLAGRCTVTGSTSGNYGCASAP